MEPIRIRNVTIGGGKPAFILGPCVIESEKFVWRMAHKLKALCGELGVQFVFKASYDKANRTSGNSFRGLGVRKGCEILAAIGNELEVPVTTDVHSPEEAAIAAELVNHFRLLIMSLLRVH